MTVLELRDLTVRIGGIPVLSGVDLALRPGERVGLIGESGSGKTMTALAAMGLLPDVAKADGDVVLDGQSIGGLSERRIARLRGNHVAMVFQEPMTALDPVMQVGRQVSGAIRLHQDLSRRAARAEALELLSTVDLPDPERIMRSYPHQLSGGQRQRVVLAMAVANRPAVLICDEPTTALDVTVQARMLRLIERLVADTGTALLFITHDLAVVSNLCERVLVMYGGRIVESGPVADVFSAPRHPYTEGMLVSSDYAEVEPGTTLRTIPGTVPGIGEFPSGCVFRSRCPRELPGCAEIPPLVDAGGQRAFACINPVGTS